MRTNNKRDCRKCGACCVAPFDICFVEVNDDDAKRLGPSYIKRNTVLARPGLRVIEPVQKLQRAGPLKGQSLLVCPSLRGSVLHRVSCMVYDRRPSVCRRCTPGKHCDDFVAEVMKEGA